MDDVRKDNVAETAPPAASGSDGAAPECRTTGQLKQYTTVKQSLAAAVRTLQDFLAARGSEARAAQCHDLMVKLAEDRFTLAVVGQFNRGKSSLMNAILGRDLLPTGVLPLTSAITVLRFGSRERLLVRREGLTFDEEAPLSTLPDYVSQRENPGNEKRVRAVYVELPSPFLRRGLEFVDTPGIGSSIQANTLTTLRFIPECDAVLFVTSVESPMVEAEREFLQTIRGHVRKVFFVVNKIDLLTESERRDVLAFVGGAIQEQTLGEPVRLFPVSARLAIAHRTDGAFGTGTADSYGVDRLRGELVEFLTTRKAETFLGAIVDKAARVLAAESQAMEIQSRAKMLPEAEWRRRVRTAQEECDRIIGGAKEVFAAEPSAAIASFGTSIASNLDAFLAAERQDLAADLRRARLFWPRGRRTGDVVREYAAGACAKLRKDLGQWSQEQVEMLNGRFRDIVAGAWRRAQSDLRAISDAIANGFGLEPGETAGATPPDDAPPVLTVAPPSLPSLRWDPPVPWLRAHVPWPLGRRWIAVAIEADGIRSLLAGVRATTLGTFDAAVRHAFARLSDKIMTRLQAARKEGLSAAERVAPEPTSTSAAPTTECRRPERDRLAERLESLRREVAGVAEPPPSVGGTPHDVARPAPLTVTGTPEHETPADHEMYRELTTRGCPVCDHVRETLFNFFVHWQHALAADEHGQQVYADEGGFCPLHSWQLAAISSPEGLSVGLPKLADRLSNDLASLSRPGAQLTQLPLVAPGHRCRACTLITDTERAYAARLAHALVLRGVRTAYATSQGVCLRHLGMLLATAPPADVREFLLSEASRHFEELAEDMRGYAIKRSATRRGLASADEEDAHVRMLIHMAGERYLTTPGDTDAEV